MCNVKSLQQVFELQSFSLDTGPQSFFHLFSALSFEVSTEICCSGVSSH